MSNQKRGNGLPPTKPPNSQDTQRPRRRSAAPGTPTTSTASPADSISTPTTASTTTQPAASAAPLPLRGKVRSKSPIFWQANEAVNICMGPLGEVTGSVAPGTVVRETSRYLDPFGNWWLAVKCKDGTCAWLLYGNTKKPRNTEAEEEDRIPNSPPSLQRVYDSRATPMAVAESADPVAIAADALAGLPDFRPNKTSITGSVTTAAAPQLTLAELVALPSSCAILAEVELFEYYWTEWKLFSVTVEKQSRSWNQQYQDAQDHLRFSKQVEAMPSSAGVRYEVQTSGEVQERLEQLLLDFRHQVSSTVTRFVAEELTLPRAERTMRYHPMFPDQVFYDDGIVYRLCVDTDTGALEGDDNAAKLGACIFRGNELMSLTAPQQLLYVPLQSFCVFGGHAFLCTAIPPFTSSDCVYPSSKSPRNAESSSVVEEMLKQLGRVFPLENGLLSREAAVYAGRDRRLYLTSGNRVVPPVLPLPREKDAAPPLRQRSLNLYSRFLRSCARPELALRWPTPFNINFFLSSVESSGMDVPERAAAASTAPLYEMGHWIQQDGITGVAGMLGLQLPISMPVLSRINCRLCNSVMEDELRMIICRSTERCCQICTHCYLRRLLKTQEDLAISGRDERRCLSTRFDDAVHCNSGGRCAGSVLLDPPVATLLHANGLNLRYLPFVLHRLPLSTRFAMEHFILIELTARAAKYVLRNDLRHTTTAAEVQHASEAVFLRLIETTGAASEKFWATRLGPMLQLRFDGICDAFQLAPACAFALVERVEELSGITLSSRSLDSLHTASVEDTPSDSSRPFVEIRSMLPSTRVFECPTIFSKSENGEEACEKQGANSHPPLLQLLERLLLFWIGYTPATGVVEKLADAVFAQPFYLDERLFCS